MSKKIKAKDLVRLRDRFQKFQGIDLQVEHQSGRATRTLADLKPTLSPKGRLIIKTVQATEDGFKKYFDGDHEFEVKALLLPGQRLPLD